MKPDFWFDRWNRSQIGFHQAEVHAALPAHWACLQLPAAGTVFVPLCGKSSDMLWLRAKGHEVLGVELSPIAVRDFFTENGLKPSVSSRRRFDVSEAEGVTLLCGDFFDLTPADLEGVAGVYDRAALIALPPDMRQRYVEKMGGLLQEGAEILLVTVNYRENEMSGPPFSVGEDEVRRLYGRNFKVDLLDSLDALTESAQLRERGLSMLREQVFRITRRTAD